MDSDTFVATLVLLAIQAIVITVLAFEFRRRGLRTVRIVAAVLSIIIAVAVGAIDRHQQRVHDRQASILRTKLDTLRSQLAASETQIKSMVERDLLPDTPRFLQPASERITVEFPEDGSLVSNHIAVSGRVNDPGMSVWVLVHWDVRKIRGFWDGYAASVSPSGRWRAYVHIGRPGDLDRGVPYEIMAVGDPENTLRPGQVLDWWPRATCRSEILNVVRR
jgi:hypothetical protein